MEVTRKQRKMIMFVLIMGSFMSSLSQSILTSALPGIMADFNISAAIGQSLTTIYILVLGVVSVCTAYLVNRIKTRKLFIAATSIFLFGCILGMLAPNFYVLLIARVIQACGGGCLMPLVQVVALNIYPKDEKGAAMGIVGLVVGFAPVLGPTVSGVLTDLFGWRSIFVLLSVFLIIAIAIAIPYLINVGEVTEATLDFLSVALFGIGFSCFMLGVTSITTYGITNVKTIALFLFGVICLAYFACRQQKLKVPLLKLTLFKSKHFLFPTIIICITYLNIMAGSLLVPMYIQTARGFSATISGFVLLPGSLLVAFLNPITGKLFDRYGVRKLAVPGTLIMLVGNICLVSAGNVATLPVVTIIYCLFTAGSAMLMMPLSTYSASSLKADEISHAVAIQSSARQMAASLCTSIIVSIASVASVGATMDTHGASVGFLVLSGFTLFAVFIAIFHIKNKKPETAAIIQTVVEKGIKTPK